MQFDPQTADSLQEDLDRAMVFTPIKPEIECETEVEHVYDSVEHVMGPSPNINPHTKSSRQDRESNGAAQQGSLSDNEKHLLEQMKVMQQQHDTVVRNYEGRINALMTKMHELWNIAEILENSGQKSSGNSPLISPEGARRNRVVMPGWSSASHTPSPVDVPRKPTKPKLVPTVDMMPLEWKRILLGGASDCHISDKRKTIWHQARDAKIDIKEVESLFALQRSKSPNSVLAFRRAWSRGTKILSEARSQVVYEVMNSINFHLDDVDDALSRMDFSSISLKSLQELVLLTSNKDEMENIVSYQESSEERGPLAEPENFLADLSRIPHFSLRVRICILIDSFYNDLFSIDDQLKAVRNACESLMQSKGVSSFLELLLAVGNYMNGGTNRGQADGFNTNVIAKLKDVKSLNGDVSLLQYLIRRLCRENIDHKDVNPTTADTTTAPFPLPDYDVIRKAATVSIKDVETKIRELEEAIKANKDKANGLGEFVSFFAKSRERIDELRQTVHTTKTSVSECKAYLSWHDDLRQPSVHHQNRVFFTSWATVLHECKKCWLFEQKRLARDNFKDKAKRQWLQPRMTNGHSKAMPTMTSPGSSHDKNMDSWTSHSPINMTGSLKRDGSHRPVQLGSVNSAFSPAKRYGSLRRSAAVNAAITSGRTHGSVGIIMHENSAVERPSSLPLNPRNGVDGKRSPLANDAPRQGEYSGRRLSPEQLFTPEQREATSPIETLRIDSPRSNKNASTQRRDCPPPSPSSPVQENRHSISTRPYTPLSDFSCDSLPVFHYDSLPPQKSSANRRRTIGGTADKPQPYFPISATRRHHSEADSDSEQCSPPPPPIPPPPADYSLSPNQELGRVAPIKARSRSPIKSVDDESPKKLDDFMNNFNGRARDEVDAQIFIRQRSQSEACVPENFSTIERRRSAKLIRSPVTSSRDSVFTVDPSVISRSAVASTPSDTPNPDATMKPMYKASLGPGPLPRPRAQTDTSPGKYDYRSALRRVSMKNPSMYNQVHT